MAEAVLDSSAILAWIGEEQGYEAVEPFLSEAACSTITIAEVVAKLTTWGKTRALILETLVDLSMEIHAVDFDDGFEAGMMAQVGRPAGLSLGDRSCLALAARLGLPAVTTDRAWAKVADQIGVEVRVIR